MLEEKSHTSSLLCAAERIFQVRNDRVTQKRRRRWVQPGPQSWYMNRGRGRTLMNVAENSIHYMCRTDFRQKSISINDIMRYPAETYMKFH